ncbi:glyoxalase [Pseudoalteromonas rubra]|uniref:Glyoxalase n=1 Tax=Pseudoalteromonas rubra TaxID=43658 RepID=A0A5S3WGQ5_9GAMM|nr:VOC family protein [Pseudoalteromonas rubra]TMP25638.1 glyoxalase [Pseudoalteromonas rubra]TMP31017.1 glyoxalase [Pseudoalteromonas rubra]
MTVSAIPDGYHALTPYLITENAAQAIEFYRKAFAAELVMQLPMPDGGVAHAELKIGDSHLMLSDMCPDMHFKSPQQLGGTPVSLMLYVPDVDSTFAQAVAAGATELRPVVDQFYGDRAGTLQDPFGHVWTIGTHLEDLSEDEIMARMSEWMTDDS